ncbi:uncharacterized protein CC84DRAFT_1176846 [Paraphaeosphaeria sporulosa]|uniref:Uncharacterized protein n=1 Tax=Paraphaeosphaeria sporulosa TaxID=1460663 RepID=A0A177CD07_9PLEO|nr:uncharacterized protein CC84DRAFT_1176846 [Paraphaeosphaeria sporulosa]OAG04658.1 hypothetical protein CC84DRAFT_1176846 [Paraphaeosphaeria sporulosa]
MSQSHSLPLLRQQAKTQRHPSKLQRRTSATKRRSMPDPQPSTRQRRPSLDHRRHSLLWPSNMPSVTPMKSVNPKEYLTALSSLINNASDRMTRISLPDLIWAFNRAHARNDRTAMRQLGIRMASTLDQVQEAYDSFCETRGTFDEEEIWKMIMGLGDEGEVFWDVVDELGDLIEIMEGLETEGFWRSFDRVMRSVNQ